MIVARYVGQVGIADGSAAIPPEHGVNSLAQLHKVSLVDAAYIDPDVSEAIFYGLLAASVELNGSDTSLIDPPHFDVVEGELFGIVALCV